MSKLPPSNLPPISQPWGRDIEKSISNIQNTARKNNLNNANNLKQINSSMNFLQSQQDFLAENQSLLSDNQDILAEQQAYLNTFLTYNSSSSDRIKSFLNNRWVNLTSLDLSFTLTRTSVVSVSSSARISGESWNLGSGGLCGVLYKSNLQTQPGVIQTAEYGSLIAISANSSYPYSNISTEYVSNDRIVTLPAGTYTFTVNWQFYNYSNYFTNDAEIFERFITASIIG